ncbi:PREDICTED: eukaryotic translation initiation factor 5B-like [Rhagoletis zephyria]|uniref:eukaryotic translation initiation factor 5B-like n=1 Tax=Rhagoletis zephyria TaxID=28612 RepID=UPI00081132B7|nr:PREDICTED: eukaryotic translation initiation factor 5B-like [Rhagoletis zephyria]
MEDPLATNGAPEENPAGMADEGNDENDDANAPAGGGDGKKKNKNRRKTRKEREEEKKAKEEAKTATKGPGKKQIALMQEQLKKIKEEEERLQREEEERIKREEEAEKARLEQLRLEQERKEKKKQKEKERQARLKKEGKLLTAKQKASQQRAKQSLQVQLESGQIVVPATSTSGGQKPKYEKLKRNKTGINKQTSTEEKASDESPDVSEQIDDLDEDELATPVEEPEVDNWELLDIDKKSKAKDKQPSTKAPAKTPTTPTEAAKALPTAAEPVKATNGINHDRMTTSSTVCSKPPVNFRSPIICVLGHVDTGKTKLLDYIRKTHVQDNEAGGITQQIGATFVPPFSIHEQAKYVKEKAEVEMPGLLIIDTPGHESFTNLRSRGSSLCDIAILVIDIMHGIEKQTIESINLLRKRKTPFVVALNKIDRLYEWRTNNRKDIEDNINSQPNNTKLEFNKRAEEVIVQLAENSINAALFWKNPDPREWVSMVPTSAHTGEGMGNLLNLIVHLTQTMLAKRIKYIADPLDATVLEVKAIPGLGTTIDVILINGKLKEGDKIVLAGHDGPVVTNIRSLLVPQPLKELRVKSPYEELKVVYGSMGVKICAHELEKAVAGLQMYVASSEAEVERLKELCWAQFSHAMKAIKCSSEGVYVQASTLGSLEALLEFLKDSKIPYAGVRIGPVVRKDVMKASTMLEHSPDHAVILAFDVKIERDAQELADSSGVRIFQAEIIYHLFDRFTEYKAKLKADRKEANRHKAVFPCKLRILPNCIFNKRDPIVVGVNVEDGVLVPGTPLAVPSKELDLIGVVSTIEHDHKALESARKGQEVCIKIDHTSSDAPKLYGRHFDLNDILCSKISRDSIDVMKEYFRDDLEKSDWQLMIELKKLFQIV